MQVMTFDYKKASGEVTKRTFVPFIVPGSMWGGVDISELDTEDQVFYISDLEQIKQEYADKLAKLAHKFDLTHRYRQFKPENMANIKTEDI